MRDQFIKVRVSDTAKATFAKAAADCGESLSDYIRRAVNMRRRGDSAEAVTELVKLRREIAAVGNNLNQIARRVNMGDDGTGLTEHLSELASLRRRLSAAIQDTRQ